jgi:predicted ATPase
VDRITHIYIKNVRVIESLDLEIGPSMTVMIGENGSGKSTIIECLEVLRKAAESDFMQQFYTQHRGMIGLLRQGADELELGVCIESEEPALRVEYRFSLATEAAGAVVRSESIKSGLPHGHAQDSDKPDVEVLRREYGTVELWSSEKNTHETVVLDWLEKDRLILGVSGEVPPGHVLERIRAALRGIEIHLVFDTLAGWAARSVQRPATLRGSSMLLPATRLTMLGQNLASAWAALRNESEAHWQHSMALVRLGLGERAEGVVVTPDSGGGNVHLALRFAGMANPIYASDLSDGQLSWLAFVAMARLNTSRSILAIDEPELHLHPSLLGRLISLLQDAGAGPVLLSTHSDRVLELLRDPVNATRVCSLEDSKMSVSHLEQQDFERWLEEFQDLGRLRAAGYLDRVLASSEDQPEESGAPG